MKQAERRSIIHGVQVCRRAPIISQLLFANDSFLFFGAKDNEAHAMKNILVTYANALDQFINLQKSEIYFSRNVDISSRNVLVDILEAKECLGTGKYLGLL